MTQALLSGVLVGGLYTLLALGFTVSLRIADIVNLAHGSFVVLGMYTVLVSVNSVGLAPYLGVLLAVVVVALVSVVVYGVLLEPARRSGHREQVVYTLLLLSALELVYQARFGTAFQRLELPPAPMQLFGITVSRAQVVAGVVALLVAIALNAVVRWTYVGKMTEVAGRYGDGARAIGIPVERVYWGVFALGSALAGLAGGLIMTFQPVSPFLGLEYILVTLLVAITARLSFLGCVAMGMLYGVAQSLLTRSVGGGAATLLIFAGFIVILGVGTLLSLRQRPVVRARPS